MTLCGVDAYQADLPSDVAEAGPNLVLKLHALSARLWTQLRDDLKHQLEVRLATLTGQATLLQATIALLLRTLYSLCDDAVQPLLAELDVATAVAQDLAPARELLGALGKQLRVYVCGRAYAQGACGQRRAARPRRHVGC